MTLYNLRSTELGHTITKFDDDLNVESSYDINTDENGNLHCHCPAGNRLTCRHRQMYHGLLDRVDSPWFLDFDTSAWVDPTGEARRANETEEASAEVEAAFELAHDEVEGPQGSLGQSETHAIIYTGNPPIEFTHYELVEGRDVPEKVITLPDSHPFRRRM